MSYDDEDDRLGVATSPGGEGLADDGLVEPDDRDDEPVARLGR